MGEGSIQVVGLLAYLSFGLLVLRITNLAQQIHTVGNHDQDYTHVLGKRQQEVPEVLALNNGVLLVELLDAYQTVNDHTNRLTISLLDLSKVIHAVDHTVIEQDGQHTVALQSFFLNGDDGCMQTFQNGVQTEHVALHAVTVHRFQQITMNLLLIPFQEGGVEHSTQFLQQSQCLRSFLFSENQFLVHTGFGFACKGTIK